MKIVTHEFMVPAGDAGIRVYLRNKHAAQTRFGAARTVLFVHGASYPAHTTFDLSLEGYSWMDSIARRGYDVYSLDLRGYGKSTRPREMDRPAEHGEPIVATDVAVCDVSAAVEHILRTRELDKLNLIGWSWGTSIMACYAARMPHTVARLVLYAAQWLRDTPPALQVAGRLGAYRTITREAALERWLAAVPEGRHEAVLPASWFQAWADATFASDAASAARTPPVLCAPNGVILDNQRYWCAGQPLYDPARLTMPVLVIHGEWDRDTPGELSRAVFSRLTNAPSRRYVVVGGGTHMLCVERKRDELFREVQTFLDEGLDTHA